MPMTPVREELVERAARLFRERFAPRAAAYDQEARFPVENYEDLHREGLLGLVVPEEYGGLGASWREYVRILKEMGKYCGSTALTFNMHSSVVRILSAMASSEQKDRYFAEVVERGRYFATLGSEPATSFRGTFTFQTFATPVAGGYRIDGHKHFCSLAGHASYYFVWALLEGAADVEQGLINLMVAADNPGARIEPTWDTMAMRATRSDSIYFERCFVPAADVIGRPGDVLRKRLTDTFVLGYAATYLGIAAAALEYAGDYARRQTFLPDPRPIAHHAVVQRRIGEMHALVTAADLALERAAELRDDPTANPRERSLWTNQAKYLAGEAAYQVTDKALLLVGGRGISRRQPLERYVRDARASHVMPPHGDACLELVGRITLGLPIIDLFGREVE